METLYNGFTLTTPPGTFPLSTDSMVLADFVRIDRQARVADLCSGSGALGVLLCAKDSICHVTGVEIDPVPHEAALDNIRRNRLDSRMASICADIGDFAESAAPGSFTLCVSNPPYFSGGPASRELENARKDDLCDLPKLFGAAARLLKWGGSFSLVHRPERLAELCHRACINNLQPKRLHLVHHHPGAPINLILLECKKGAKPALDIKELFLFDETGAPTDDYRRIYHL